MAIMEEESVKLIRPGDVTQIQINRPKSLNALNPDVLLSLSLLLEKLAEISTIKAVVLSGAGDKAFVAGADVSSMAQLGPRAIADYVELGQRALRAIETFPAPVIAEVQGYALGGGLELALACDLIFASKNARLGQPEVNLGIIPGFGGTQRLIQRCGIGTARRLTYTGEIISADEALRLHLVDGVYEHEALSLEVSKLAHLIAKKAPLAVRAAKQVIRRSQEQVLLSGLRLEVEGFLSAFSSADREEGMAAFLQKREPKFIGK
jgi:enoyl-CoA hydratase